MLSMEQKTALKDYETNEALAEMTQDAKMLVEHAVHSNASSSHEIMLNYCYGS
jgi:hypothetical protein